MNKALPEWVRQAPVEQKEFREAVHVVLHAIALTKPLQHEMIMKGGILLGIAYNTGRFTRDIDFSTSTAYRDFDQNAFLTTLCGALAKASDALSYQLECRLQTYKLKPAKLEGNFQTLHLRIAYAYKNAQSKYKRVIAGTATTLVDVDYSFNEHAMDIDILDVDAGDPLKVYGLTTLIAEKLRAVLQQEERNRIRRQDIFDLNAILDFVEPNRYFPILSALIEKAASRELTVTKTSFANPDIYKRSQKEDGTLAPEIEGDLPDFDVSFLRVRSFYESLPWDSLK